MGVRLRWYDGHQMRTARITADDVVEEGVGLTLFEKIRLMRERKHLTEGQLADQAHQSHRPRVLLRSHPGKDAFQGRADLPRKAKVRPER